MIKKISSSDLFIEKLRKAGKVRTLNSPEDIQAMLELNKQMEAVRRDFKYKNNESEKSASQTYLD